MKEVITFRVLITALILICFFILSMKIDHEERVHDQARQKCTEYYNEIMGDNHG